MQGFKTITDKLEIAVEAVLALIGLGIWIRDDFSGLFAFVACGCAIVAAMRVYRWYLRSARP
jgi:hypothetical protein